MRERERYIENVWVYPSPRGWLVVLLGICAGNGIKVWPLNSPSPPRPLPFGFLCDLIGGMRQVKKWSILKVAVDGDWSLLKVAVHRDISLLNAAVRRNWSLLKIAVHRIDLACPVVCYPVLLSCLVMSCVCCHVLFLFCRCAVTLGYDCVAFSRTGRRAIEEGVLKQRGVRGP